MLIMKKIPHFYIKNFVKYIRLQAVQRKSKVSDFPKSNQRDTLHKEENCLYKR